MHVLVAFGVGVLAGGALSYLYARKVIAKVQSEVAAAKSAVKKAL